MTTSRRGSPLILLVEDNETIRHAFSILLEEGGYRVLQVGTGEDAISTAERMKPNLVLMDLGLPDMSGLEVTRHIKANPATTGVTVIAITGRALETDQAACLEAGCSGYLAKPIDTEQLLRRVSEFLDQKS
jgi:two-component system, cell cycle response regulator DivK